MIKISFSKAHKIIFLSFMVVSIISVCFIFFTPKIKNFVFKHDKDKAIEKKLIYKIDLSNNNIESEKIKPFEYYKKIIDRNLMKRKNTEESIQNNLEKSVPTDQSTQVDQISLKLWGTFIDTGGLSYAIISQDDNKKNCYKIGDTIQNAAIAQIEREKVTLILNNNYIYLIMEKIEGKNIEKQDK
ncbi:MAG: hypothetical protein HQK79_21005 [Desulfobacterales bacterium]|nr:hypothetical protein [Desulfobacterales bacterium]